MVPAPCRYAHWSTDQLLGALSLFVTVLGLGSTAVFTGIGALHSRRLLRSQRAAKLDIPARPFDRHEDQYGHGLALHLDRHIGGCFVQFSGGLRNVGQFVASEVSMGATVQRIAAEMLNDP